MKVDLVVNTMMQQIDRNMQSQVLPAAAYRAGELLRGRVMLTDGEGLQIRLDNGALLNAMPSGDVILSPGATITLRVTGQMDGQLVMQLMDQEINSLRSEPPIGDGAALLKRMGLEQSQQGQSVAHAMERMKLPMREETARTAMDTMARFPSLSADKAVFLAANRITANTANVDALNRLVDGRVMTGDELTRLAELLMELPATPLPEAESGRQPAPQAYTATQTGEQPHTQQTLAGIANLQENASAMAGEQAPAGYDPADVSGRAAIPVDLPARSGPIAQAVAEMKPGVPQQVAAAVLPNPDNSSDAVLQLQSLVQVALGVEVADSNSGVLLALQRSGLAKQAVAIMLEGPLLPQGELRERMDALISALPQQEAAGVRQFINRMVAELGKYITEPTTQAHAQPAADTAIGRVLREITGLFAKLDGDAAKELMQAATDQKGKVSQLLSDATGTGAAGQDVVRQLGRVASHVQLIHDISQYAYQQIPVMLEDKQKTVELYVMNKGKGGRKVKADQANILIALDTDSMGHVETLINVSQKNLRLRFGVEKPELVRFVEGHMTELGRAMGEIGYRVSDLRTQVINKPVSPLTVAERVAQEPAAGALDMRL